MNTEQISDKLKEIFKKPFRLAATEENIKSAMSYYIGEIKKIKDVEFKDIIISPKYSLVQLIDEVNRIDIFIKFEDCIFKVQCDIIVKF